MANMGGNSDTLKGAIEEYIAGATGYEVKVGTLNKMTFFPSISVDIENVQMLERDKDNGPVVTMGRLYGSIGFRSVAFSAGELKALDIDELHAQPGALNAQAVFIDNVGIVGAEDSEKALLQGRGKLGNHAISFEVEMEIAGKAYKFGPNRPFKLSVGDMNVQGVLADRRGRALLQDFLVGIPDDVMRGNLDFTKEGKDKLRIGGDVGFGISGKIQPDLVIRRVEGKRRITGAVQASIPSLEDVNGEKGAVAAYQKFRDIFSYNPSEKEDDRKFDLDIELTTENGCIHLMSENVDEIMAQLPKAVQIPSVQKMAQYPCGGTAP